MVNEFFKKIRSRPLSAREKTIFNLAAAVIGLAVLFQGVIIPVKQNIVGVNQDIARKKALLRRYMRLRGSGEKIRELYRAYKEISEASGASQDATAGLFKIMQDAAQINNLVLERVKPQPIEEKKTYKKAGLEIELKGEFSAIFSCVADIEKAQLPVSVSYFWLAGQAGTGELRCRMIVSYVFFE